MEQDLTRIVGKENIEKKEKDKNEENLALKNKMEKEKINEIMKETCFESLAYCCGLSKLCPDRDGVLKKLKLTKKDFKELKENFNKDLYNLKGGKK